MRFAKKRGRRKKIPGKGRRNRIGRGKWGRGLKGNGGGDRTGQGLAGGVRAGKETEHVEEQVPSGKDGLGKWREGKGE